MDNPVIQPKRQNWNALSIERAQLVDSPEWESGREARTLLSSGAVQITGFPENWSQGQVREFLEATFTTGSRHDRVNPRVILPVRKRTMEQHIIGLLFYSDPLSPSLVTHEYSKVKREPLDSLLLQPPKEELYDRVRRAICVQFAADRTLQRDDVARALEERGFRLEIVPKKLSIGRKPERDKRHIRPMLDFGLLLRQERVKLVEDIGKICGELGEDPEAFMKKGGMHVT